ncbi:uncharacterized protein C8A04DRAFT_32881 [Dichotomopilus funicola]|uniref:EDC4-like protein pdc1 beta-propeller domain-containing protein n=1 Tax=Dichotomopilus funicola TaxID=1934379 RepID=A0AAN6UUU8_9PEZI|nr:hypothetical protein C8A04DRAFT_32881 [Dichotomopilus funicola]
MSNYGMSGGGGSGDSEHDPKFESLLAQLRLQSSPSPGPGADSGPEYPSQFNYHHGHQSYYGPQSNSDSPNLPNHGQGATDSPAFLPEAPTPPVGFGHSQFPPGMMNQIGAAARSGAGDGRTAHLLNLLKFSGQNGSASQQQQQQQQQQQHQQHSQHSQHHSQQHQQHHSSPREQSINFPPAPIAPPVIHAPAPAAADPTGLLAALMKGNLQPEPVKPEPSPPSWNQASPPSGTQQYLLNLLNRPKPSQHEAADPSEPSLLTPPPTSDHVKDDESSHGGRSAEPTLVDTLASRSEFDFESKNVESPPPKFDSTPLSQHSQPSQQSHQSNPRQANSLGYSDHYDRLSGSSPIHRTPKSSTTPGASGSTAGAARPAPAPTQILKRSDTNQPHDSARPFNDRDDRDIPGSPPSQVHDNTWHSAERNVPPALSHGADTSPSATQKESVADAVSGLAEQADREARDALARAEQEQAEAKASRGLDPTDIAETAEVSHSASSIVAKPERNQAEEERSFPDSSFVQDFAQDARDSADDSAAAPPQGLVADSWESAEAEEIVVIEETAAPVKVYNFPMKPWITISLQDTDETRPVFREEAILDIARLKKDFDQIDRNLVSASETYMAYAMSKAGGLRVIRQEDGKDAKLFTDTKDRIFNVSICNSSSEDHPKETIIGTGVNGTVYWVQLKNGDRDHLEDAHPEQYGFALPPISSQEGGDAPGGVLKTRARPSAMHPDFFAVGRGKSINIIWPSFVFENDLFKNGHDRIVDTEKLLKQCSLKINTGKAGKDFTFSQDDTLVVSLDKSGRVKFWDVRDLTAVKEGSDPLHPTPAQASLEIKEPLMTLTTTPEGEKAWPTSVLLLDKFRPYQKRAALRYMIVGMKQNHTLQLWDLALGKPVQEFNFPHNKESDAVCSVMYHAPSSMIIVGHPTRNSIYFLHLSAPKYTLKNLSQVDYIQRLVAQDSSIPQPESTAVISGIREYSFANKGILRSLNILENPAASSDGDEPTLFELYAMHSKGVTCLFIKHSELGWTKDNKVIAPADAVEAGLAKISKLVAPPPPQPAETQNAAVPSESAAAAPQIRIATRGAKDAGLKAVSPQGDNKKASELVALPKPDRKDDAELPAPAPEKNEKKGRKKKSERTGAGASDHLAATNGAVETARASSQGKTNNKSSRAADSSSSADAALAPNPAFQEQLDAVVAKMESRIISNLSGRFDAVFNETLKQMQSFHENRDSAFSTSQSTLLQLVADVLNDNTEAVLKNLIITQINNNVIPSVRNAIDKSVSEQLGAKSAAQVSAVQKEIQRLLPNAINQAMQRPDVTKPVSDRVSQSVNSQIDSQIARTLNTLTPVIAKSTAQTVHQRIIEDVGGRISQAFEQLDERRRNEDAKFDRLIAQTQDLASAISSLAASQAQMQQELAALKQQVHDQGREKAPSAVDEHLRGLGASHGGAVGSHGPPSTSSRELVSYGPQHHQHQHQSPAAHSQSGQVPYSHQHQHQHQHQSQPQPQPAQQQQHQLPHQQQHQHQSQTQYGDHDGQVVYAPLSREERQKAELDNLVEAIEGLMRASNYDEAMLRWLQSGDHAEEVFQQVLSNYNPIFVQDLQPLLLLSVGATVSVNLSRNTQKLIKKINLLEVVIYSFNQNVASLDEQVREVTPKIMTLLKTRIDQLLSEINRIAPHDQSVKTLSSMSSIAGRVAENAQLRHGSMHGPGHIGASY